MSPNKHLILLAIGFPPAAKSSAYRLREIANQFAAIDWDVTVVTIADESWESEYGLDYTLLDAVDPRVRVVKVPIARKDIETNIRNFTRERALRPIRWVEEQSVLDREVFPEPVFGGWLPALESAVLDLYAERPADLVLASCAPYVFIGVVKKLWDEHKVPYAIDFRDGWSLDVITGDEAFALDSRQGRIEAEVLSNALGVWCVNDPIAEFYQERYPAIADRVHVARNGFDAAAIPGQLRRPDPAKGLDFGYVGSVNFRPAFLAKVLEAWHDAREADELIARSRFEIRGHIGSGWAREANAHVDVIKRSVEDDVHFGGPVPNAEMAATFGRWDVLVLMLVGGRHVTSGKVYEYAATGLPIVSAHEVEHDASVILRDRPLWSGAIGTEKEALTRAFIEAGQQAVSATEVEHADARQRAQKYARAVPIASMAAALDSLLEGADS